MKDIRKILRQRFLAFSLVAAGGLGSVCKEQWGLDGGPVLDGVLMACFCLGLGLWVGSKRMERRSRRQQEEERE